MGDTITEIENAINVLQPILPVLGGVVGTLVPGAAPAMSLATPFLSVINEILAAIETLKSGGMSHTSAVAVVGQAVTTIGQTITSAVPPTAANAAAAMPTGMHP